MKNKFSLGADPELFLTYNNGNGKSAIGLIPGTKEDPYIISTEGHSVQVDNVLLEFNVPPANNSQDMFINIQFIMAWFKKNIPKDDKLNVCGSMIFDSFELKSDKAKEFGCDPDFNAWTESMNESPKAENIKLRSAGGHIHISYADPTIDSSLALIKALDLYLGVPSILIDTDTERRKLYGKAGCFRLKKYSDHEGGVEYRTLSNFWIKSLEDVEFIFQGVDKAFSHIKEKGEIDSRSDLARDIVNCINSSDKKLANRLINKFKLI